MQNLPAHGLLNRTVFLIVLLVSCALLKIQKEKIRRYFLDRYLCWVFFYSEDDQ